MRKFETGPEPKNKSDIESEPKKKLTDFFKEKKNKNQHGRVTIQKNEESIVQNGKESITQEPDVGLPFAATPNISFSKFTPEKLKEVHEQFSKMENSDDPLPKQKHRLQRRVDCLKEQLGDKALKERDYVSYKFQDEDKQGLSKVGKKLEEWRQFYQNREILEEFGRATVIENKGLATTSNVTTSSSVAASSSTSVATPSSIAAPSWIDDEVAAPTQFTK